MVEALTKHLAEVEDPSAVLRVEKEQRISGVRVRKAQLAGDPDTGIPAENREGFTNKFSWKTCLPGGIEDEELPVTPSETYHEDGDRGSPLRFRHIMS